VHPNLVALARTLLLDPVVPSTMKPQISYLASPYSDPDPDVRHFFFLSAAYTAGRLIKRGLIVYSPIAHGHPIAAQFGLPTDWAFWRRQQLPFLRASKEVIVLTLRGWNKSIGVKSEIRLARSQGIPVRYCNPLDLEFSLWPPKEKP
jgi:hypothetical protein